MEYVEGINLHDFVFTRGKMTVRQAADCIRQAALGLQHAHEAILVHRDIQPANLLLDAKGTVKILDMGLALFFKADGQTTTQHLDQGLILGTVDYLAPEQTTGKNTVDLRADIYSLGMTFFFLLTGRTPYGEGTETQKLQWHRTRLPVPVRELRPDVPKLVEAIIAKMLAKEPKARFQVPAEIAAALAPWADGSASEGTGAGSSLPLKAAGRSQVTPVPGAGSSPRKGLSSATKTAPGRTDATRSAPTAPIAAASSIHGNPATLASLPRSSATRPAGTSVATADADTVVGGGDSMADRAAPGSNTKSSLEARILALVNNLPALPDTASRAMGLANDPKSTLAQFSKLIEGDVGLATGILRLANSPMYEVGSPVKNVYQAVVRLGTQECQFLMTAVGMRGLFQRLASGTKVQMEALWSHGFTTASLCRLMNRRFRLGFNGEEFVSGLLHDLGRVLLALLDPENFPTADPMDFLENIDVLARERAVFNSDHCVLGAWFGAHHQLPKPVVQSIRYHHRPLEAEEFQGTVALVAAADDMANHIQRREPIEDYDADCNPVMFLLRDLCVVFRQPNCGEQIQAIMDEVVESAVQGGTYF